MTPSPTALPLALATVAPPAVAAGPAVDDPRFYRGSFVYDPQSNRLLPVQQPACCLVAGKPSTDAAAAAVQPTLAAPSPANRGTATSLPAVGKAMYYNPGIMDQVLAYRLALGQVSPCPECVGYVALLHRGDLNRKVWIEWSKGDVEGPFLVIDVAATQHVPLLSARQWVVDVDHATAVRRAMNGPVFVTVLDAPPRAPYQTVDFTMDANIAARFGP